MAVPPGTALTPEAGHVVPVFTRGLSGNRFLFYVGLALTAAATLTAGGLFWTRLIQKSSDSEFRKGKQDEKEPQEEKTESQTHLSWAEIVEEDEAMEALHNVVDSRLDDEQLSSKLNELNIEKDITEAPLVTETEGGTRARQMTTRTDSGVASPNNNATPSIGNVIPTAEQQSSADEAEDSNFDSIPTGLSSNPTTTPNVLSDSGQGSEADEGVIYSFHFIVPNYLCGKLIGVGGASIKQLKAESKCNIKLNGKHRNKNNYDPQGTQTCIVEGTRSGIDKCIELIRERFPLDQHPTLTLEQINPPDETCYSGEGLVSPYLGLLQGELQSMTVSTIISGGQICVQQTNHPTFRSLERLNECMRHVYFGVSTPEINRSILNVGLFCAAPGEGIWNRVQVLAYDSTSDLVTVKCIDYGNEEIHAASDLRQIRSDFLALPVQSVECLLANVMPINGLSYWPEEASFVLSDILSNKVCSGQMVNFSEDYGFPVIQLYAREYDQATGAPVGSESEAISVNRELVERGVAVWVEDDSLNY